MLSPAPLPEPGTRTPLPPWTGRFLGRTVHRGVRSGPREAVGVVAVVEAVRRVPPDSLASIFELCRHSRGFTALRVVPRGRETPPDKTACQGEHPTHSIPPRKTERASRRNHRAIGPFAFSGIDTSPSLGGPPFPLRHIAPTHNAGREPNYRSPLLTGLSAGICAHRPLSSRSPANRTSRRITAQLPLPAWTEWERNRSSTQVLRVKR
jgi:hypothetical protein